MSVPVAFSDIGKPANDVGFAHVAPQRADAAPFSLLIAISTDSEQGLLSHHSRFVSPFRCLVGAAS